MVDMCPNTCQHLKLCACVADMYLTTCHNQGACTCMVDMCPPHGTSRGHGHAWVACVPTHVTSRKYGYAWVPCILKMAPPSNQVELVLLLVMTINGILITPSFHVRFGRFWDRWKAYQEHNLALIPLLGSEARKALQIYIQNNDCNGRC